MSTIFDAARRRTVLSALIALVLLVGFLRATPARADALATVTVPDRSLVVQAWLQGGEALKAAAAEALTGADSQVLAFLNGGLTEAQHADERDAVAAAIADSGPSVRAAAQVALDASDAGSATALDDFLAGGRQSAANIDLRVQVNQLMATGGAQVRAAAQVALDSENPGVLQDFLDNGWQTQWQTDQRLKVNQVLASGGPEVKAAAQKALDDGSSAVLDQFLTYGWDVASAHDDEVTDLQSILAQAQEAEAVVERETQNATEQAQRAQAGAAAAKRSAQIAAQATADAKANANKAAAASNRAATAARKAAQSAQTAIDAAAAASQAARTASLAASRASRAASKAAGAASDAYKAAANAALDHNTASNAKAVAEQANRIAQVTEDLANRADKAGKAIDQGLAATTAATAAANEALAAADANDEAIKYATQAGAQATKAVQAAKVARANAQRAVRAANAAKAYMQTAAKNAYAARDAALAAAADARKAAAAAIDSADHAADAAQAATKATEYAAAAATAANKVVDLAGQAIEVYNAARTADAERLAVATDEALEAAQEAAADYDAQQKQADWDTEQATRRDAETKGLIATAQNLTTAPAVAVTAARKAELSLATAPGEWTRNGAQDALGGDDPTALAFIRTGLAAATAQDNRLLVTDLASGANTALTTAAEAALAGSDAAVAQFLATQSYPGRYSQDRLKVNQILAAAKSANRTITIQKAQAALDTDTPLALRTFVEKDQYPAAATDDRLQVNQLMADPISGPEVKAAAQVALDGPLPGVASFLSTGQYEAIDRDNDLATHLEVVNGLVNKINQLATTAVQRAQEAQSTAAKARGDATKATDYANAAIQSANKAAGYANAANNSAINAAASAQKAAAAANTARNAATRANTSARSAMRSALWAQASHEQAVQSAQKAHNAAVAARDDAIAAGKDADAARAAGEQAYKAYQALQGEQIVNCEHAYSQKINSNFEDYFLGTTNGSWKACTANVIGDPKEMATRSYINSAYCDGIYHNPADENYKNCIHSTLSPDFRWMHQLVFIQQVVVGLTMMIVPAALGLGALCVGTIVCGAVVGNLLGLADIGLNLYRYIKGDQSLADTLMHLGTSAVEALAFNGAAKLASIAFRSLKAVYSASKLARNVQKRLDATALININLTAKIGCLAAGLNSFTPGTPILLDDGTSKAIADIRLGDVVKSEDTATGDTFGRPVTGMSTTVDTDLTDLTVGDGAVLHTTGHHPLWDAGRHTWAGAGDLVTGDSVGTYDGPPATITGTRSFTGSATMLNLTIDDLHTYFVGAGAEWLLVHNAPKCGRAPAGYVYRGGLYKYLKDPVTGNNVPGTEINHMPSKQSLIQGLGLTDYQAEQYGIAIQMDEADHVKTESWGSSYAGQLHRAEQAYLLNQGNLTAAITMDLDNLKVLFPNGKYDKAVEEMRSKIADFLVELNRMGVTKPLI